jgi:hypothetical protein
MKAVGRLYALCVWPSSPLAPLRRQESRPDYLGHPAPTADANSGSDISSNLEDSGQSYALKAAVRPLGTRSKKQTSTKPKL